MTWNNETYIDIKTLTPKGRTMNAEQNIDMAGTDWKDPTTPANPAIFVQTPEDLQTPPEEDKIVI